MAGLTAILVSPILESMERKKIPSSIAIVILCCSVLFFLLLIGVIIFPLLTEQIFRLQELLKNIMQEINLLAANPDSLKNYTIVKYLERAFTNIDVLWITDLLKNYFGTIAAQIGKFLTLGGKSFFTWIF
jgi:predicted PurR-regulated permease PerM